MRLLCRAKQGQKIWNYKEIVINYSINNNLSHHYKEKPHFHEKKPLKKHFSRKKDTTVKKSTNKLFELSLAPQIRLNSSKLLYKALISEVHVLCLRSNVEVTYHFKRVTKVTSYVKVRERYNSFLKTLAMRTAVICSGPEKYLIYYRYQHFLLYFKRHTSDCSIKSSKIYALFRN